MLLRRAVANLIAALSGMFLLSCSRPYEGILVCEKNRSVYECGAHFSDGKGRVLEFVTANPEGLRLLDSKSTTDDFGDRYCVELFEEAKATFRAGDC